MLPDNKPLNILHLSDLHFGRIDPIVLERISQFIQSKKGSIHLTILTGDVTQRARREEFRAAKKFLNSIHAPLFLVPGNHDIPLYNLFLRFFSPYRKFMKYLGPFAGNYYEDEHLAVFGLWTTDYFTVQSGKIHLSDLTKLEEKFGQVPPHKIKIIAGHHPLTSMAHPKAKAGIERILKFNPHIIMWGHEHTPDVTSFNGKEEFPLLIASGTSTSTRTKVDPNSFNFISITQEQTEVGIYVFNQGRQDFECIKRQKFLH